MIMSLNLQNIAGEADKVGTNAEAGTTAGRHSQGGHVSVQNAKSGRGNKGNEANLIQVELALGDGVSGKGDQGALHQIFNGAFDQLA